MIPYILICVILAAIAHHQGKSWAIVMAVSVFLTPLGGIICLLLIKPDPYKIDAQKRKKLNMKKCPLCAEMVRSEATVCRYCGAQFVTSTLPDDSEDEETDGPGYVDGEEEIQWTNPSNKYLTHVMINQRKKRIENRSL